MLIPIQFELFCYTFLLNAFPQMIEAATAPKLRLTDEIKASRRGSDLSEIPEAHSDNGEDP